MMFLTGGLLLGCNGEEPRSTTQPNAQTGPSSINPTSIGPSRQPTAIAVTTTAFGEGAAIPATYSCHAGNVSPPLAWTAPPPGTAAFALVLDDPDAVGGLFIHWVVTDIPPSTRDSPEGGAPAGGRIGQNSGGARSYLGPCPPAGSGVHHYRFTVYALSAPVQLPDATSARQAVDAIAGRALAQGVLVGTFSG